MLTDLKQTGKPWESQISSTYRPFPQRGFGKGVLIFTTVLAKKKREVLAMSQSKVRLEKFF